MRTAGALSACLALALGASACGNALQLQPVANRTLQPLVTVNRFPIYWAGGDLDGLPVTSIVHDYGGAYSIQYGACEVGGQSTCMSPLLIVTSPDNSFKPGPPSAGREIDLRGDSARVLQSGKTIEVATGLVIVDIYARTASLARAAAATMVPVNRLGYPGSALPAPNPTDGYGDEPLPGQLPHSLRVTRGKLEQSSPH